MNSASEIDPWAGLKNENRRLREALESLHSADAKYRAILTRSPSPCWILQDGQIAFVNPAMLRMLGASSEDQVKGHTPCEFIHPDFHAVVLSRIQSALDTGIPVPDLEELFVRLDGALIAVQVTAMPIPYECRSAVQASFVETSERRRFEQALRKSERNLRLIAENTTEVILAYNMDRKPLYANPAFERHTGYSLEEIYARHFIVWIHPDDQERMLGLWEDLFRGKAFYEEEYRLITKQGQMKWSSATWSPLYDESGRQVGVQGRERDVSEKKKAEEARRQTEARYRLAFANATVGVSVNNEEGRFLEANPAYCTIMGYSETELKALDFRATTYPDDMVISEEKFQKLLAGILPAYVIQKRYIRKDGAIVWGKLSVSGVHQEEGQPVRVIAFLEEITEQKRAEAALVASEDRFRRVFENSPLGMSIIDRNFHFIKVNAVHCEMLGYSPEELASMTFADFLHPDDLLRDIQLAESLRRGEITSFRTENRHIAKSGEIVHAGVTVAVLRESPWEALAIVQNITDRKRAEEALRRSEEQLRQVHKMEAIGLLAGGVAHDFNNILTVINGYSGWLLNRVENDDPNRIALLAIQEAGEKAAALTRQLLAFGRRQVLQPQLFNLVQLIRRMSSMLRRLIRADISLHTRIDVNSACVQADPAQIEQAVINLVINASDAMPAGGALDIFVGARTIAPHEADSSVDLKPGNYVLVAITDTGTGMGPETLQHIFEPFFTTKPVGQGTGLGLSTVYGVARQSGGTIWVRSTLGEGSTFTLYLPESDERPVAPELPAVKPLPRRCKEVILLVEDNRSVRTWAAKVLRDQGYDVLEADTGQAALARSATEIRPIDLLLTDVVMPGMSGRQLAERLSAQRPNIKVLFISGYSEQALGQYGILDAGLEYLPKPFGPDVLLQRVSQVLGKEPLEVVLADDDAPVRTLLAAVLEEAGYAVRQAANGLEAMSHCRQSPAQLLITDLAMPEQEGIETIRAAKHEFPNMRIIAISGVFTGTFSNIPLKLGADAVLQKPIDGDVLLETVESLIG